MLTMVSWVPAIHGHRRICERFTQSAWLRMLDMFVRIILWSYKLSRMQQVVLILPKEVVQGGEYFHHSYFPFQTWQSSTLRNEICKSESYKILRRARWFFLVLFNITFSVSSDVEINQNRLSVGLGKRREILRKQMSQSNYKGDPWPREGVRLHSSDPLH